MKTILFNDAVAFVSTMKMEDLKKIQKFNEKALVLVDDDGFETFAYKASNGSGAVAPMFIYFNEITDDGKAMVRVTVKGETTDDKKTYIAENFGAAISNAAQVEAGLTEVLAKINEELTAIKSAVQVAL